MHILITRFPFESQLGGEEIHSLHLAQALVKKGHRVTLMTSCPVMHDLFKENGLDVIKRGSVKPPVTLKSLLLFTLLSPLHFLYLSFSLISFWKSQKASKENLVLYCHSLSEKLLMSPIARLLGFKIIWVEHARIGRWLIKNPWIIAYRLWASFCHIIAPSKQTAAPISWAKNLHIIPHGVRFDTSKLSGNSEKTENDTTKILCVARLSQDKGVDYLIKAFKKLTTHTEHPVQLDIVGMGPLNADLEALTTQLSIENQVTFHGKIPHAEVEKLYRETDVVVLPSTEHDPFGLVIVEAMIMGKPVVATQVCGATEFLDNGEEILTTPEKDENALFQAINTLLTNHDFRQKIAQNGHKAALTKFNHDRMVEDYIKLFSS